MKLNVFLFTDSTDNIPEIDSHYNFIIFKPNEIKNFAELSQQIRKHHPVCFVTVANCEPILYNLPYQYRKKWINFDTNQNISSSSIENCYIISSCNDSSTTNPLFSIITTTFHSGEKIKRPYESLMSQTYNNWEWVLWDDSKPDYFDAWNRIQEYQKNDIRIKCFKTEHSGFIGDMKFKSASLAKGDWIVELDHDDIIDSKLLEQCRDAVLKYPNTEFICSNCIELFEDSEEPFQYGDHWAYGYGSYQKEWIRGKWHNVAVNWDLNPTTIRHIVGVPNHIRIWKRSLYEKIGKHNSELPVVDDYELLIRTFLNSTGWIHLNSPSYLQYRNTGGNNFTFLRNALIQKITAQTYSYYHAQISNRWSELGWDTSITDGQAWRLKKYNYNTFIKTIIPTATENTISILILANDNININDLVKSILSIQLQTTQDWLLYIIGDSSNNLEITMNTVRATFSDEIIKKIKWWNLSQKGSRQISLNYMHRMLFSTNYITYLSIGNELEPNFLEIAAREIKGVDYWNFNGETLEKMVHTYSFLTKFDEFNEENIKK